MDFVEVGNVSTTSGFGSSGQNDEAALLLKSVVDNKISFQQGKTLKKMCESLRRHARRSAGVDLRDYTDLDGLLPMTNVLASLPRCLAPPPYRMTATGSLRELIRSKTDLQALADMFCAGDLAASEVMLASGADEFDQPVDFGFPLPDPLRRSPPRPSTLSGRSDGMGRSAGSAEGVDLSPGAPYDMVDLFHQGRGEDENGDDGDEDDASMFEGPLSVLFELFQTPRGFTSGVTNLCDTCGLESPLPVPTAESVHALLFPLPASTLRRLAGKLCLRVPDIRWTAQVRNEQVVHPLVGKLLATLHAYSAFMDQRGNDEERGGGRTRPRPE